MREGPPAAVARGVPGRPRTRARPSPALRRARWRRPRARAGSRRVCGAAARRGRALKLTLCCPQRKAHAPSDLKALSVYVQVAHGEDRHGEYVERELTSRLSLGLGSHFSERLAGLRGGRSGRRRRRRGLRHRRRRRHAGHLPRDAPVRRRARRLATFRLTFPPPLAPRRIHAAGVASGTGRARSFTQQTAAFANFENFVLAVLPESHPDVQARRRAAQLLFRGRCRVQNVADC